MAGQLRTWGTFGAAGFILLGLALKGWQSRSVLLYWLRIWGLWFSAAIIAGLLSARFLRSLPMQGNAWSMLWASADWQMDLWTIGSLPLMMALGLELRAEKGGFEHSALAALVGLALAPLFLGAFPGEQMRAFLEPFVLLVALARLLPKASLGLKQVLGTLALLNALGFAHGLFLFPPWLGGLLLGLCLALGLNPYGLASGVLAASLAALGLCVKAWLDWGPALGSTALICVLIACGWLIPSKAYLAPTA
jgi:hypothetical protein